MHEKTAASDLLKLFITYANTKQNHALLLNNYPAVSMIVAYRVLHENE